MTYLDTPGQEIGERSEDGEYEWDGQEWVPTADAIDSLVDDLNDSPAELQIGQRSEDEQYEWDGEEWVPTADAIDSLVDDLNDTPSLQIGQRSEDGEYEWDGEEWVPTADAIDSLVDDLNEVPSSPPRPDGGSGSEEEQSEGDGEEVPTGQSLDGLIDELAEEIPTPPQPQIGERSEDGNYEWDGQRWAPTANALDAMIDEVAQAWEPDDRAMGDAADGNQAALKETPDGGRIGYHVGGFMLLIGDVHPNHYFEYVQSRPDHAEGTITIEKGGFRSPGTLVISGCPPAKQGVVESLIGQFSKKKIRFE